jgi:hypothetical protein
MIDLAQPAYEPRLTYPAMLSLAESGDVGMQRLPGDVGRRPGGPRFPGNRAEVLGAVVLARQARAAR